MIKSLILLVIMSFVSLAAQAEMVSFTIDKEAYQTMSPGQQKAVIAKASELNEFLKQQVYPKIPSDIKNQLKDFSVTISFSNNSGRDGLFIPEANHTNKIILSLLQLNSNGLKALLAHEFFHAIHFELNPDEEPWMREGMAQLFEYITTNELSGANLQAALANPLTPLIGQYDINDPNPAQYGHNLLYFYYLTNHCGKENLFWKLATGNGQNKGAELIDSLLTSSQSKASECRDFYQSALSFEVAKMHNQIQFTKEIDSERFFLAPTNLPIRPMAFEMKYQLVNTINQMPIWSSLRIKLDDWNSIALQTSLQPGIKIFYAKKTFPYDVGQEAPATLLKNIEVIIVKTPVLTEVSSKYTGK